MRHETIGYLVLAAGATAAGAAAGFIPMACLPACLLLGAALTALAPGGDRDSGDGDGDEGAPTIVAMPVWMIEELEKRHKEKMKQGLKDQEERSRTLAFDPSQVAAVREAVKNAGAARTAAPAAVPPPAEPDTDQDMGAARTLMFDPGQAAQLKEELATLRAPVSPAAKAPAAPKPEEEAYAPTQVFMKAVDDDVASTVAYTPEMKEKILAATARKGVDAAVEDTGDEERHESTEEIDTGGATAVYSADEVKQFRAAYDLLRDQQPGEAAGAATGEQLLRQGASPEVTDAPTLAQEPEVARAAAPCAIPAPAERKPATQRVPAQPQTGQSLNAAILLLLLLLAVTAGAVILHMLDVITLPVELPRLGQ